MELNKSHASNMFQKNVRKFLRNKLAMIGMVVMLVILLMCVFAPIFTSYRADQPDFSARTQPPNLPHILGTDKLGRDVFSRILYGGRYSILIGVTGAFFGSLIGVILGAIAGYFGKLIDSAIVRLSEIFQTVPNMILILILGAVFGRSISNLLFIFAITGWMTTFRIVRNEFIALKGETYVQVCEAFGMSKIDIMFKQILPNVMSPVIVATTVNVAHFILSEAGLSFIGVGVPSATPTWGNILNAAKSLDVISNYWWLWVVPGVVITVFVLAVNFFGDGLRDVLDPKQQ